MADSAEGRNVRFPDLSEAQIKGLRAALGEMVALANPLDYHTFIWNDVARMTDVFSAMLEGPVDFGAVIADFPRKDRCDPSAWDCVVEAGAAAVARVDTPLALLSTLPETMPEDVAARAIKGGMIPMHGIEEFLAAIEAAAFICHARVPEAPVLAPGTPQAVVLLDEREAKRVLAEKGLDVPRAGFAPVGRMAADIAANLGFPVVLKGMGVAHKTEAGLVALGLTSQAQIEAAVDSMACEGFLIEEMVGDGVVELLIGVVRDPAHGFVLTLGAGGTLTEIHRDTVSLLLPVTEDEVEAGLGRLRIAPVLAGYRGKPGVDMGAIVAAVMAVQGYVVAECARLDEVEINPLICTPTRAVAADALIRKGE